MVKGLCALLGPPRRQPGLSAWCGGCQPPAHMGLAVSAALPFSAGMQGQGLKGKWWGHRMRSRGAPCWELWAHLPNSKPISLSFRFCCHFLPSSVKSFLGQKLDTSTGRPPPLPTPSCTGPWFPVCSPRLGTGSGGQVGEWRKWMYPGSHAMLSVMHSLGFPAHVPGCWAPAEVMAPACSLLRSIVGDSDPLWGSLTQFSLASY